MRKLAVLLLLLLLQVHSTGRSPASPHTFLQVSQSDSPALDQDDVSNSAYPVLQFPTTLSTDSDDFDDSGESYVLVPRSRVST